MSLRFPLEPVGAPPIARRAAEDPDPELDFRGRAEQLLARAGSTEDGAVRAALVIKAATLHHLALLREAGRQVFPYDEPASFAQSKVEAQMLGQGGERRGLRGGPPVLKQAQAGYASANGEQSARLRRTL